MINFLISKHKIENKENLWGKGEWVLEPDHLEFIYKDYRCRIIRVFFFEGLENDHLFGGFLCGYVYLPAELKDFDFDQIDVHDGVTYNEIEQDNKNWIGFDCAHTNDYIPSMERLYQTDPKYIELREKSKKLFNSIGIDYDNSPINQKSYKNIDFCIQECKNLVDQIIALENAE